MSAESNLIASLMANSTLKAVISTRLEPAPRRVLQTCPDMTWHVITRTFEQPVARAVTGVVTHYQFDAWDDDALGCEAIISALKTALLAYTSGIHSLEFMGEYEVPEPEDTGLCHRALTVAILT